MPTSMRGGVGPPKKKKPPPAPISDVGMETRKNKPPKQGPAAKQAVTRASKMTKKPWELAPPAPSAPASPISDVGMETRRRKAFLAPKPSKPSKAQQYKAAFAGPLDVPVGTAKHSLKVLALGMTAQEKKDYTKLLAPPAHPILSTHDREQRRLKNEYVKQQLTPDRSYWDTLMSDPVIGGIVKNAAYAIPGARHGPTRGLSFGETAQLVPDFFVGKAATNVPIDLITKGSVSHLGAAALEVPLALAGTGVIKAAVLAPAVKIMGTTGRTLEAAVTASEAARVAGLTPGETTRSILSAVSQASGVDTTRQSIKAARARWVTTKVAARGDAHLLVDQLLMGRPEAERQAMKDYLDTRIAAEIEGLPKGEARARAKALWEEEAGKIRETIPEMRKVHLAHEVVSKAKAAVEPLNPEHGKLMKRLKTAQGERDKAKEALDLNKKSKSLKDDLKKADAKLDRAKNQELYARVEAMIGPEALDPSHPLYDARQKLLDDLVEKYGGRENALPPTAQTTQELHRVLSLLDSLATLGARGREWYRNSALEILNVTKGNMEEAEKLAQLVAIYSPQQPILGNTSLAVRAYNDFLAKRPIGNGQAWQKRTAQEILDGTADWKGRKTNNFYRNIMGEIVEATTSSEAERRALMEHFGITGHEITNDMWMARSVGYMTDNVSGGRYDVLDALVGHVARERGWKPREMQAAIWTHLKDVSDDISANIDFADAIDRHLASIHGPVGNNPALRNAVNIFLEDAGLLGPEIRPAGREARVLTSAAPRVDNKLSYKLGLNERNLLNAATASIADALGEEKLTWLRPFKPMSPGHADTVVIRLGRPGNDHDALLLWEWLHPDGGKERFVVLPGDQGVVIRNKATSGLKNVTGGKTLDFHKLVDRAAIDVFGEENTTLVAYASDSQTVRGDARASHIARAYGQRGGSGAGLRFQQAADRLASDTESIRAGQSTDPALVGGAEGLGDEGLGRPRRDDLSAVSGRPGGSDIPPVRQLGPGESNDYIDAVARNPEAGRLVIVPTPERADSSKLFLREEGGEAGFAVANDGEFFSVFKNSGPGGWGYHSAYLGVEHGATWLRVAADNAPAIKGYTKANYVLVARWRKPNGLWKNFMALHARPPLLGPKEFFGPKGEEAAIAFTKTKAKPLAKVREDEAKKLTRASRRAVTAEDSGPGAADRFDRTLARSREGERGAYLADTPAADLVASGYRLFMGGPGDEVHYALSPGGDIVGLGSRTPGHGKAALAQAILNGGRTLDAFDGGLIHYYEESGFREVARNPWDDAMAPEGWNYERDGRPDVVHMAYRPDLPVERTGRIVRTWEAAKEIAGRVAREETGSIDFGVFFRRGRREEEQGPPKLYTAEDLTGASLLEGEPHVTPEGPGARGVYIGDTRIGTVERKGVGWTPIAEEPFHRGVSWSGEVVDKTLKGAADRLIRHALMISPAKEELPGMFHGARSLRGRVEVARSPVRGERLYQGEKAFAEAGGGVEGLHAKLRQHKGQYPTFAWRDFQHFTPEARDAMINELEDTPKLRPFEKMRAQIALMDAHGKEKLPTPSDLDLLEKVFGKQVTQQIKDITETGWDRAKGTITGVINLPRSVESSFDYSALFRQALVASMRHPVKAAKNTPQMVRFFWSKKAYREAMDAMEADPDFGRMMEDGISFTDMDKNDLNRREEFFTSRLAEIIPGIKASGRAYSGFLNLMRFGMYKDMAAHVAEVAASKGRDGEKATRDLAGYINAATGRGGLWKAEKWANELNTIFFSPRLFASRIEIFQKALDPRVDPRVRLEATRALAQTLGATLGAIGLAKLAGADIETDPRNADFGKIRVGRIRVDPFGGFQQTIRLIAQEVTQTHISSRTGKSFSLANPDFGGQTPFGIAFDFARNKLAPTPALITDIGLRKTTGYQPVTVGGEAKSRLIPLLFQDVKKIWDDTGSVPATLGLLVLGSTGIGVQDYPAPGTEIPPPSRAYLGGGGSDGGYYGGGGGSDGYYGGGGGGGGYYP